MHQIVITFEIEDEPTKKETKTEDEPRWKTTYLTKAFQPHHINDWTNPSLPMFSAVNG